jgi:hypothetical protein
MIEEVYQTTVRVVRAVKKGGPIVLPLVGKSP